MWRIGWVRVTVDDDWTRAEVSGVGHRLPQTLPVPLAVAAALAADGVRLLVRRQTRAATC